MPYVPLSIPSPDQGVWYLGPVPLRAYALLIVYASLYPFEGWRLQGLAPWAFLTSPWTRWWTAFDFTANAVGYAFKLALQSISPDIDKGKKYKVITGIPGKTGIVYTLDRRTGEFLWARPTVRQNVVAKIDGGPGVTQGAAEWLMKPVR